MGDCETYAAAFLRVRDAAKTVYRVLVGVPQSAVEWCMYFGLWPLSGAEIERAGSEPRARAARRRQVERRGEYAGAILSVEFGGKSLNPHAHLLVISKWLEKEDLNAAWLIATGDSHITHVGIADVAGGVAEVVKGLFVDSYEHGIERTPAELVELFAALLTFTATGAGRSYRRVEALGVLRGKIAREDEVPALLCGACGSPLRAVGIVLYENYVNGVWDIPESKRFRRRGRSPPQ
jgi:hypothetical protein